MGKLMIDTGTISATKQINNAKAKLIEGGPVEGTEQERLVWFVERVMEYVRDVYRRNKRAVAIAEAEVTAEAAVETWE